MVLEKAQELWRDEVSDLANYSLVVFAQCSEGLYWQLYTFKRRLSQQVKQRFEAFLD